MTEGHVCNALEAFWGAHVVTAISVWLDPRVRPWRAAIPPGEAAKQGIARRAAGCGQSQGMTQDLQKASASAQRKRRRVDKAADAATLRVLSVTAFCWDAMHICSRRTAVCITSSFSRQVAELEEFLFGKPKGAADKDDGLASIADIMRQVRIWHQE